MKNYPKIITEFHQYVLSFYNSTDGVYPIATKKLIEESVNQYLESKPLSQIYFDSFDREEVRCIIEPSHSIFIPK
jgi:hypothetical protein